MSTIWGFYLVENKHTLYYGKGFMKDFCDSLKEHTKNILDFGKKKKMLSLTRKDLKSHKDAKACYICGKGIQKDINY